MRSFGDMSHQSFWNTFYANRQGGKRFDWFVHFEDVAAYLEPHLPILRADDFLRILDIGCGTSDFSWELFEHLNRKCRVDCVDFSFEAIKAMEKFIDKRGISAKMITDPKESMLHPCDFTGFACHQADVKNLPFNDGTFALVFDKGTSDAALKGPSGEIAFGEVVKEAWRVLRPNGKLIQFTDEPPELRLNLFEKGKHQMLQRNGKENCEAVWVWRELEVRSGFQHFMYVVHKVTSASKY